MKNINSIKRAIARMAPLAFAIMIVIIIAAQSAVAQVNATSQRNKGGEGYTVTLTTAQGSRYSLTVPTVPVRLQTSDLFASFSNHNLPGGVTRMNVVAFVNGTWIPCIETYRGSVPVVKTAPGSLVLSCIS